MLQVSIQKHLDHLELDVSLQAHNEIIVLAGSSGAGKTSILQAIAGLAEPDSGTMTLNEKSFFEGKKHSLSARSRNNGYVFQDYALFPHMTVERNNHYGIHKQVSATTGAPSSKTSQPDFRW
ncbi:ATP-binding cassette domain-containing protein [Sporosarcina gallistercoris]|uniref:ATP-binding cassette domain-containing protein n=1 Tax=Sporosarcina gallistercoris TaxID=2762245 RepID=UPI003D2C7558